MATAAREKAYARYSDFKVGVALMAEDGTVFTGANIESLSSGLALCAERVALAKGVSEGHRAFKELVLVADSRKTCTPCGTCRQALYEFGAEMTVVMVNLRGDREETAIADLLPGVFRLKDDRSH